ncbi:hypothetical protein EB001_07865 [bacterium]|nr:hypothetical protein [bacterium]
MKTEGSIRHKLKQVKYRIVQKAIRNGLSRKPCNCKHSGLVKGASGDDLFYVCLLDAERPKEWEGMICDNSVPPNCPFFKPDKTKEEIEKEVDELLASGDMGEIARVYPDIAALLWVLGGIDELETTDEKKDESENE